MDSADARLLLLLLLLPITPPPLSIPKEEEEEEEEEEDTYPAPLAVEEEASMVSKRVGGWVDEPS